MFYRPMNLLRHTFCAALILASGSDLLIAQAPPPAPAAPAAPAAAPAAGGALNIQAETEALMNAGLALFSEGKYTEALAKIGEAKKNLNNKPFPQILFV